MTAEVQCYVCKATFAPDTVKHLDVIHPATWESPEVAEEVDICDGCLEEMAGCTADERAAEAAAAEYESRNEALAEAARAEAEAEDAWRNDPANTQPFPGWWT